MNGDKFPRVAKIPVSPQAVEIIKDIKAVASGYIRSVFNACKVDVTGLDWDYEVAPFDPFRLGVHFPRMELGRYYAHFHIARTKASNSQLVIDRLEPVDKRFEEAVQKANEYFHQNGILYRIEDLIASRPQLKQNSMFYDYCTEEDHVRMYIKVQRSMILNLSEVMGIEEE